MRLEIRFEVNRVNSFSGREPQLDTLLQIQGTRQEGDKRIPLTCPTVSLSLEVTP